MKDFSSLFKEASIPALEWLVQSINQPFKILKDKPKLDLDIMHEDKDKKKKKKIS